MNKEAVAKYVKAGAAVLACAGIAVSPESQSQITGGFLVVYSIVSAVQGRIKDAKK